MQDTEPSSPAVAPLRMRGGAIGAIGPLVVTVVGVTWLGLAGAPDERGLWPVLILALLVGVGLARDRDRYCRAVLDGMSRPLVLLMVMAWILAGVFGQILNGSGLVDALVALATSAGLTGGAYVAFVFGTACLVASATGTSLGTLIVCFPLLYPAGAALAAEPALLAGAILAGATFGDNISPVSDTTIASATTQQADIGGVVRSRVVYAVPAAAVALMAYFGLSGTGASVSQVAPGDTSLTPLVMLTAALLVLGLLWRGHHLVEGLLAGIAAAAVLGLAIGALEPSDLLRIDAEAFTTRGVIVSGIERGLGISVFTLLLMGIIGALEATGIVDRALGDERVARSARGTEIWIFGAVSTAVLLTTHSVVAILTVGEFARRAGSRAGVGPYRRANLLDTTVCTYPFLLPWFIPTVLAASLTASGADAGMPRLSALAVGTANFYSWLLLAIIGLAIATGYGHRER